ncbi:hypothetical protein A0H76_2719 [Hepatospora eriocheir]|uniref:Uncharacterized protein n=1 Tax=Hepatospora eriocheir TaxID=1081669 RepID=A0A1X0QA79_9MICR|nr:hypothetical protein HERIO_1375 [Hepatospora eriocheir]ORD99905.1 hypothetical protein A0H76_2719 [Hepatospora eriocheir]
MVKENISKEKIIEILQDNNLTEKEIEKGISEGNINTIQDAHDYIEMIMLTKQTKLKEEREQSLAKCREHQAQVKSEKQAAEIRIKDIQETIIANQASLRLKENSTTNSDTQNTVRYDGYIVVKVMLHNHKSVYVELKKNDVVENLFNKLETMVGRKGIQLETFNGYKTIQRDNKDFENNYGKRVFLKEI